MNNSSADGNRLSYIEDRLQLEAIIVNCAWLVDHGKAADIKQYLTQDAVLRFGPTAPQPGQFNGIQEVAAFFEQRQLNQTLQTRHVVSNIQLSAQTSASATADYVMTVYRGKEGSLQPDVIMVADVTEKYEKNYEGEWLLALRLVDPFFALEAHDR